MAAYLHISMHCTFVQFHFGCLDVSSPFSLNPWPSLRPCRGRGCELRAERCSRGLGLAERGSAWRR